MSFLRGVCERRRGCFPARGAGEVHCPHFPATFSDLILTRGRGAVVFGGRGGAAENGRGEGSPEPPSLLIKAFRYSDLLPAW